MKNIRNLIPTVFIALAIIVAFSTRAMDSRNKFSTIQGYVKGNPTGTICHISIFCSDNVGPLCMVGTTQVFGKDLSGKCILEVYRDSR